MFPSFLWYNCSQGSHVSAPFWVHCPRAFTVGPLFLSLFQCTCFEMNYLAAYRVLRVWPSQLSHNRPPVSGRHCSLANFFYFPPQVFARFTCQGFTLSGPSFRPSTPRHVRLSNFMFLVCPTYSLGYRHVLPCFTLHEHFVDDPICWRISLLCFRLIEYFAAVCLLLASYECIPGPRASPFSSVVCSFLPEAVVG